MAPLSFQVFKILEYSLLMELETLFHFDGLNFNCTFIFVLLSCYLLGRCYFDKLQNKLYVAIYEHYSYCYFVRIFLLIHSYYFLLYRLKHFCDNFSSLFLLKMLLVFSLLDYIFKDYIVYCHATTILLYYISNNYICHLFIYYR